MTGLKNLLQDIGDEARPYDVFDRALVAGARRRRLRRVAAPIAAAVVAGTILVGVTYQRELPTVQPAVPSTTAAIPPSPSAAAGPAMPTQCAAHRLPVPAGALAKSIVSAVDPTGRYIGGRSYLGDGGHRAILWVEGVPTTIPIPGDEVNIEHITSSGVVLGSGYQGGTREWTVYENGKASRLKGVKAHASDMNDHGVIVGRVGDRPAVWRTPTGQPELLALPPDLPASWLPTGIDDDGTMVGFPRQPSEVPIQAWIPAGTELPSYAWLPDGSIRQLPAAAMPDGSSGDTVAAGAIRNGWVIGRVFRYLPSSGDPTRRDFTFAGIRWNVRTGQVEVSPTVGRAVNAIGWQVGDDRSNGVLFSGGAVTVLPHVDGVTPNERAPGPHLPQITGLSDDGRTIVGYQALIDAENQVVAVVWRCS